MKKETLEEVIERLYPINIMYGGDNNAVSRSIFVEGVKWEREQDKKMYSEEEVQNILIEYVKTNPIKPYRVVSWFNKFKNK
jgi:hypothetical protein